MCGTSVLPMKSILEHEGTLVPFKHEWTDAQLLAECAMRLYERLCVVRNGGDKELAKECWEAAATFVAARPQPVEVPPEEKVHTDVERIEWLECNLLRLNEMVAKVRAGRSVRNAIDSLRRA